MATNTHDLSIEGIGSVSVTVADQGHGHMVLLLHGGGGPQTVAQFAQLLASSGHHRVVTPSHPGFAGTPRPDRLGSIHGLAATYAALLQALDAEEVTVIGNSIGGWIAAELALVAPERVRALVIVDGVGIDVPGHPIADFFSLTPRQVAELSYHDPDRFGIDPAKLPPEALAAMAGNRAALAQYAGTAMAGAGLRDRLGSLDVRTLVVWGDADRIADVDYGRAYASAIRGAHFVVLTDTGHLPQIESPEKLLAAVMDFTADAVRST